MCVDLTLFCNDFILQMNWDKYTITTYFHSFQSNDNPKLFICSVSVVQCWFNSVIPIVRHNPLRRKVPSVDIRWRHIRMKDKPENFVLELKVVLKR